MLSDLLSVLGTNQRNSLYCFSYIFLISGILIIKYTPFAWQLLSSSRKLFHPEDGGTKVLLPQHYTASQLRSPRSETN